MIPTCLEPNKRRKKVMRDKLMTTIDKDTIIMDITIEGKHIIKEVILQEATRQGHQLAQQEVHLQACIKQFSMVQLPLLHPAISWKIR